RSARAVPLDRAPDARPEPLRALLLETAPVPLGKAAIDQEADEADEEAHRLRSDEILGVDHRRDACADRAAEYLADEHRAREEREQTLRLGGVVEVSGVHPEEDVDRLLDAVGENIRDGLDDPAVLELPLERDARLDGDRKERDAGDVPEEEGPAPDAIDEEEDHRRHREHRDGRNDVHNGDVVKDQAIDEQPVEPALARPVRDT